MTSRRRQAGLLLVVLGLALLVWSALQGDLRVGLFLVVPYVVGTGLLPFLGFVLLVAGAFLALAAGFPRAAGDAAWEPADAAPPPPGRDARRDAWEGPGGARAGRRAKHGGFVLLGPIPIVWGNDRRMLPWLVLLGIGLVVLMLVLPMLLAR